MRQTEWLTEIFEQPYIKSYALGNMDAWLGAARFGEVETKDMWLVHQVSSAIKPLPDQEPDYQKLRQNIPHLNNSSDSFPAPAY